MRAKDTKYEEILEKDTAKYTKHYTEGSFKNKIKYVAARGGSLVIYVAFLLYGVMKDEQVSFKTKAIIIGALGYLILPFDLIPDMAPVLGLTDDLGVLLYAINQVRTHITPAIRGEAIEKVSILFPKLSKEDIDKLEDNIF